MKRQASDLAASLGTRKARAVAALLQHGTKEKAAQEAGVNVATLWRWSKQPEFKEALAQARREAFSQTTGRLQRAAPAAVQTLMRIMAGEENPASSKVAASRAVIELMQKSLELEDMELRLSRLEKQR
jgi:uncharacterized protein YhjY with autotransporter beta-barrel domain